MTQKIVKLSEVWDRLNQLHACNYLSQYAADNLYSFLDKAPSVSGEAVGVVVNPNVMGMDAYGMLYDGNIADGLPLYTTPQPDRVAELEATISNLQKGITAQSMQMAHDVCTLESYESKVKALQATNKKLLDAAKDLVSRLQGTLIDSTFSINAVRSTSALRQAIAEAELK